MRIIIQASIRIVLFNLVPVLLIIGIINAIDMEAATYYVSKTASSTNCSAAQNRSTPVGPLVENGLNCLSRGDTLRIRAGDYGDLHDSMGTYAAIPSGLSSTQYTVIEGDPLDPPLSAYLHPLMINDTVSDMTPVSNGRSIL